MALPANISTGRVTGQFIVGVADGADVDDEPDFIAASGTVAFTASTPYLPNPTASPNPVTMLKTTILAVLDSEGYICTPSASDPTAAGKRGIRLVATDDPDASVEGWTWKATPQFLNVNGTVIHDAIRTFDFALPSGSTVDLTTVVKVPASQGIGTEQAEALAASAQAHAASADAAADAAAADAKDAREGVAVVVGALPSKADLIDGKVPADQLPPAVGVTDEVVAPLVDMPETAAAIDARVAGQVAGKLDADTAAETFQTKTDAEQAATELTAAVAEAKATADAALANGGATITPDPANPGLYIIPAGGQIKPDPANTGLYLIGA